MSARDRAVVWKRVATLFSQDHFGDLVIGSGADQVRGPVAEILCEGAQVIVLPVFMARRQSGTWVNDPDPRFIRLSFPTTQKLRYNGRSPNFQVPGLGTASLLSKECNECCLDPGAVFGLSDEEEQRGWARMAGLPLDAGYPDIVSRIFELGKLGRTTPAQQVRVENRVHQIARATSIH